MDGNKFNRLATPNRQLCDLAQLARGGCAAALVSVPNRYMHSPVELISLSDAEQTARLIAETVAALSPKDHFIPA